jgi:hypothetical protein
LVVGLVSILFNARPVFKITITLIKTNACIVEKIAIIAWIKLVARIAHRILSPVRMEPATVVHLDAKVVIMLLNA